MANLIVSPTDYEITDMKQNTVTVNFTCNETLTDVKLSMDNGSSYRDKISMTQTSAIFDITGMDNNNYACKLKGFYEEVEPPTPVQSVSLNEASHIFTDFTTMQLNATVLPVDATDKSVYWSSTNTNVATVNQDGLVTAKANGATTIIVMTNDGNKSATCSIVVDKDEEVIPPTYEFDVVNKTYRGSKNTIVDIEGVCTYPNIDYWEVNSQDGWVGVANSFENGKFKLELPNFIANKTYSNCVMYAKRNKMGEEQEDTIVATAPTKFTLVVEAESSGTNVESVKLNKNTLSLAKNTSETLIPTILPSTAINKNVTWKSSNTACVGVGSTGEVLAYEEGTSTITVTTVDGAKTDTCFVTVTASGGNVPVSSVGLDKTNQTLEVGKSFTLTATVLPSSATNKNVNWSTSNYDIAEVSNGTVTAKAEGSCVITVTTQDGYKTATCNVTVIASSGGNEISIKPTSLVFDAGYQYESKYIDVTAPEGATIGAYSNNTQVVQVREINKFRYEVNSIANGSTGVSITVNGTPYNCLCTVTGIGGGSGEPNPIVLPPNLYVNAQYDKTIYINYETNVEATQHFLDKNDGNGYVRIYPSATYTNYSYSTNGIVSSIKDHVWKLKVTDYRGNEATSNINITLNNIPDDPSPEPSPSDDYDTLKLMYPMPQAHGVVPNGAPSDWKNYSRWENQYKPSGWRAFAGWAQVYRVEGTSFSQNTGVELKDYEVYGWKNGQWHNVTKIKTPTGGFYAEDFTDDAHSNFPSDIKMSNDYSSSIIRLTSAMTLNTSKGTKNVCFHPFTSQMDYDSDFEYIFTCVKMRKVKWNENGIDDRDSAKYCASCGGDWWREPGLQWAPDWSNNKGIAQPKIMEVKNEWKVFSMSTVPQSWDKGFPVNNTSSTKNNFRGVAYVVKAHENGYTALEGLKQYEKYNHQTSLLCLGISCNFDTNIPTTAITDSLINTMCDNVESKGLSPVLKCHTVAMNDSGQGNTEQPTNPSLWFSNYKKVVDRIADIAVARGYKEIIISNEMNMVTNISSWKQYFAPIISSVKAKGLKVGCSVNYPEVVEQDGFQYFNEIDFIGLNLYVSLTKDGKQWAKDNPAQLREGFYTPNFSGWGAIRWGDFLRDLGGNSKDIWITELGCIPNTNGLYAPAYWGEGYQRDEEVQKIYMDTLMDILENDTGNKLTGRIKKYILWDGNSDSDYNMVGKQGEVVLDKYWLDKTVTPPPTDDGNYFDFNNEIVENYGCTSIIDKTNKTIKVTSDYSAGYYGYLIWDTSDIREGRRYRLTCKSSSDKTFVRFKVDDKRIIDQAFKTSYSIEFDGVNTKEKIAELNFGIRNASNIGEISSIFSEIELIDLDGTPPPTPSTDVIYDVVDYKIIVKKDSILESYHANDDIPINLNGNGGVDGYKLVIKNRRKYYLSLTRGTSPSKITIDGMKPFNYSYIDQDFKNTWSNRGYAVKNNTLKYTIANRIDNDEYGITNDRTINPSVLTEALRVYNCAIPNYMEITQDQNSVNSVSEASFEDNFLGICRLYQGEKFHIHQNIRLLGGFGNSSRFYVAVLVHELGHTTGIWDDSPHYPTVYIYNRDQSNEWLQPSDIACIKDKFPHLTGQRTRRKAPTKTNNDTSIVFNYPHYKDENEMVKNAHKVVEGKYVGINYNFNIKGYIYNLHEFECKGEIVQVKIHESFDLGLVEGEKYRLYLNEFDYLLNPKQTMIRLG